ncbi:hypothetical protein EYF80_002800 [Liparis tanakae]|uniref:Secreted protein n=1 Tax=Liparis tanakae TaxID=230148 RepID=A0A4Z2J9M6_9TELE|nr:hypothetical protein EYF80_002800 [Liparis tanakae]
MLVVALSFMMLAKAAYTARRYAITPMMQAMINEIFGTETTDAPHERRSRGTRHDDSTQRTPRKTVMQLKLLLFLLEVDQIPFVLEASLPPFPELQKQRHCRANDPDKQR